MSTLATVLIVIGVCLFAVLAPLFVLLAVTTTKMAETIDKRNKE